MPVRPGEVEIWLCAFAVVTIQNIAGYTQPHLIPSAQVCKLCLKVESHQFLNSTNAHHTDWTSENTKAQSISGWHEIGGIVNGISGQKTW